MNKKGISVVEVIVAVGIFTIISASVVTLYLGAFSSNLRDTEFFQADMLLQQGLEASRSIRDFSFSNLSNGTHGLTDGSGYWEFSGSSDTTGDYTRTVVVSSAQRNASCNITPSGTTDANSKEVKVTVSWDLEAGNNTSISATEYLNNWTSSQGCEMSGYLSVNVSSASLAGGNKRLEDITVENLGSSSIIIDKILPTWSIVEDIKEVKIDNTKRWKHDGSAGSPSGKQPSGVELDLDNVTLTSGSGAIDIDKFDFDGSMSGASFTFLFTMTDGSTRYVEVTPGAAPADTTAPAAVSNLAASSPTTTTIDLDWTAPGDDGSTGTATSYDVRYSTSTITAGNWGSATTVTGEPTPAVAGSSESMTVSSLTASTTYYFAIKTTDEAADESSISNITNSTTLTPDTTAPAAISDLNTENPSSNTIGLSWTAPGDDGSSGTATTYDVRYSTSEITAGNWGSATAVTSGEPTPAVAGSSESMTVTGLSNSTTYYFAIKTSDEVPNESAISNVPNDTTDSPSEADDFVVDTSGANIAGGGDKELRGITVQNTSGDTIVIAKITVTWTNGQQIEEVKIEGDRIWKHNNEGSPDGRQNTGTELDVEDYDLDSGNTDEFDKFKFNGDMDGDTFTIKFELGDGSTYTTPSFSP
ncbi:fibronectin type III domain-containing protein [Candidatus Gracilibacteria bacterium]|nr:fibronectin type III domain-containing protein [Candidatus Gracilibacteria bacterium]